MGEFKIVRVKSKSVFPVMAGCHNTCTEDITRIWFGRCTLYMAALQCCTSCIVLLFRAPGYCHLVVDVSNGIRGL